MYKLHIDPADFDGAYNDFFKRICQFKSFSSEEDFNLLCRSALEAWPQAEPHENGRFGEYLKAIEEHRDLTIRTPWGGVFITRHEHPLVEKYLVVRAGHYLSFEKHVLKDERLKVEEGRGVLLQRQGEVIRVRRLMPGTEAHFAPGEEHCIIAPEDLLIFENSLDHKGMDQDLVFIYQPR